MHHKLSAHAMGAAAILAAACISQLATAACEVPLPTYRSAATANVMILFDNSGSMNEAINHPDYDPTVTYSGNFQSTTNYYVSTDGTKTPRSFNSFWPSSPSAYLINSDGGESGLYTGNYLNWIFFKATSTQRAALPTVTRVQVAKQAVNTVLAANPNNRYGVMTFNNDVGGVLVSPMGTATATIQTQVNGIAARSATPLAETLVDIMDYYKKTDSSAPILGDCQKSFVIIVSDGHPTKDLNIPDYLKDYDKDGQDPGNCATIGAPYDNTWDCSGYMDDVAMYMFANDMRPDLEGLQNVTTFVIGFNIYAPILESAARQGGGAYFGVNDPSGLGPALGQALNLIDTRIAAGSSVSVMSAENRANNRLYRARYETITWRGFLEAFDLPYKTGDAPVWRAGDLLQSRDPASRQIFTSTTGTDKVDFTTNNASQLKTPLLAVDVTTAQSIIQYVRGVDVAGYRNRQGWKLGDIVDSSPITVGKPSAFYRFLSYSAFRSANAGRTEVIYVGANDGMLHCFNASTGNEEWAYVPKNQLPKVAGLMSPAYCHEYFVNMTPAVYDIHVNGGWKTLVIGGEERGGSGLFALDVTDPAAAQMKVLWDVNISQLKGSWNKPALIRDKTRNGFVLCAGTGLDATGAASLVVLDPANGSVLATHALGTAAAKPNMATAPVVLDKNFDGYDDLLYVGDLSGSVWRVDLTTDPWTVSQLFKSDQPIQSSPVLSMDEQGRVLVFFGTGQYLTEADLTTTSKQTLYGIFDNHSGSLLTRSNLVDQTSTINSISASNRGWYIDLTAHSGERAIRTPALIAGVLYVPTFRPNTAVCKSGGESWLYSLDFADGSVPDNADGSERNTTSGREKSMGQGVLSNPVVDVVNEDIVLQNSNATMITQDIDISLRRLIVRSWRQVWN